ncbi:NADP-dependent isocitrate dehydrogenase [Corynebacterium auriscanis]|uniref:Isocitrate dehydrogenase [NADP] n=1 Tax=Corynebacterium auriscanis TaxID=99807 RepID=A0A0A2DM70_9CORY|nr:NADP-dependent isocitrate dehydrogenase [Corynebacterium auriscanis]KGM18999.1 isocitrate dehydrogenase [Corynebacterium auriscanis]WJY73444.1 Isocitrate dehydrogenase [NADP] [Corynebacterium auriscanis]
MANIIYTRTDEAPLLATYSLKPIVEAFAATTGVQVETRDISLAARILAAFNDRLPKEQQVNDALQELGELAKTPEANIVKLPNISASVPQLKAAIAELQKAGYDLPDYPAEPSTDEEKDARTRYDSVKGSAVNPVLREGNSDRRAPKAVKNFVRKHPHSMGEWTADSKTNVATMEADDFRRNEQSVIMPADDTLRFQLVQPNGETVVLKDELPVLKNEIVDATVLSANALDTFLRAQVSRAKAEGVLFSVHLKATMMKVSDPIIFGHAVRAYFSDVFEEYGDELLGAGLNGENGLGAILDGLESLEHGTEIREAIEKTLKDSADLAMVDSDNGITNLHVPSDVIVDASMPAMIRNSGQMWNADGNTQDTLAVLPDSSYSEIYQVVIDDCRKNGAFDPTTMGTVPNVGLMAQKAEEYGSHDKTFKIPHDGRVQVLNSAGEVLMEHEVSQGDIWRACQAKDIPVQDWVKLAVNRAAATGAPAVFWLDPERAHDRNMIEQVNKYLGDHDTEGLEIHIMSPTEACQFSLDRIRAGKDTISVTGNVLRDYLTDLFPIMELGTSAKMLSIVPLIAGGGLFETGAGGSAPKHVQQVQKENHLRWDSLGEFLALAESLRKLAETDNNPRTPILGDALDVATEKVLDQDKSPSRKVGEIDNRGSHFYLAMYWARELANQDRDEELAKVFAPVADALEQKEQEISQELIDVQGTPADLGGYYWLDDEKVNKVMRPSETFNQIIDSLKK